MTAVIGMVCSDGIVIAADQQISVPGQFKYHECKIEVQDRSPDWIVTFAYAGSPSLMKEAKGKILEKLRKDVPDVTPEAVHAVAESVLEGMGRQYVELDLQLLIATVTVSSLELLRFDGQSRALYAADGFNCLGVGDSSLIRFLSDALYSKTMSIYDAANLAVYLIDKAKKYIDHCGGETDLITIKRSGECEMMSLFAKDTALIDMQSSEDIVLKQILEAANPPKPHSKISPKP
ncbi:MAG TPA: hypothetical protein VMX16_12895 [Terriglobia bacterium]|nr:hypothetical protein [Terriglobia bacterium]